MTFLCAKQKAFTFECSVDLKLLKRVAFNSYRGFSGYPLTFFSKTFPDNLEQGFFFYFHFHSPTIKAIKKSYIFSTH